MRKLAAITAILAVFASVTVAQAQNVKSFKGGGGPTGFNSAMSGSWVKEYRGNVVPNPGPTTY